MTSGRGSFITTSSAGSRSLRVLDRLVGHEDVAGPRRPSPSARCRAPCTATPSRSRRPCPRRSSTEMPGSSVSSIVTTPSGPTRSSASATAGADDAGPPWRRSSRRARARRAPLDGPGDRGAARPTTRLGRLLDAAPQQHRVGALVERAHALAHDRLGQQRRRRRAVAGQVGRLVGDLAHELRAHVAVLVGELDLARDRDAVVGDRRRTGKPLEHDVAALRAERHLDRVGQLVDAGLQQPARLVVEVEPLAHVVLS